MTVTEAARVLGLDVATVRRHIEHGYMRAEKVHPRLYLIPSEEVERWRATEKPRRGPKPKRRSGPV